MGDKTGRNAPCPCGSGKKYKHCCLKKDEEKAIQEQQMRDAGADEEARLRADAFSVAWGEQCQKLKEETLQHLEDSAHEAFEGGGELAIFTKDLDDREPQEPLEALEGLTPEQVRRLLRDPFDSPDLVTFRRGVDLDWQIPVLAYLKVLVEGIREESPEPDDEGLLPVAFCRCVLERVVGGKTKAFLDDVQRPIERETDHPELHITRALAEITLLIGDWEGCYEVGEVFDPLVVAGEGNEGLYLALLQSYCEEFDWACWDHYGACRLLQYAAGFLLYLLHRYGDSWRPNGFYEDRFLRAFPLAVDHVERLVFEDPEEMVRVCVTERGLVRFAAFFGLAELELVNDVSPHEGYRVRKSPMFDRVVRFNLGIRSRLMMGVSKK